MSWVEARVRGAATVAIGLLSSVMVCSALILTSRPLGAALSSLIAFLPRAIDHGTGSSTLLAAVCAALYSGATWFLPRANQDREITNSILAPTPWIGGTGE